MDNSNKIIPNYYSKHSVTVGKATFTPLDLIDEHSFVIGSIFKYLIRYKDKGQIEDLKKAYTYISYYLESKKDKSTKSVTFDDILAKNIFLDKLAKNNELFKEFYLICFNKDNTDRLEEFSSKLEGIISNRDNDRTKEYFKLINSFTAFTTELLELCEDSENYFVLDNINKLSNDFKEYKNNTVYIYSCMRDNIDLDNKKFNRASLAVLAFITIVWITCHTELAFHNKSLLEVKNNLNLLYNVKSINQEYIQRNVEYFQNYFEEIEREDLMGNNFIELIYEYKHLFETNIFDKLKNILNIKIK